MVTKSGGFTQAFATANRQRNYSDDLCYKLGGACCQPPVRARPHDGLQLVERQVIETYANNLARIIRTPVPAPLKIPATSASSQELNLIAGLPTPYP